MLAALARDSGKLAGVVPYERRDLALVEMLKADDRPFRTALRNPNPHLRLASLMAYRQRGDTAALPVYRSLLDDPVLAVRATAAAYLVTADTNVCVPALLSALDSGIGGGAGARFILGQMLKTRSAGVIEPLVPLGIRQSKRTIQTLIEANIGTSTPYAPRVTELLAASFAKLKSTKTYIRQLGFGPSDTMLLDSLRYLALDADTMTLRPVESDLVAALVRMSRYSESRSADILSALVHRRPALHGEVIRVKAEAEKRRK